MVPHAAEARCRLGPEAEMHEQVDTLLTHLYGTGGYEGSPKHQAQAPARAQHHSRPRSR